MSCLVPDLIPIFEAVGEKGLVGGQSFNWNMAPNIKYTESNEGEWSQ